MVPRARTVSRRRDNVAPPLNLPSGFASTTVPVAEAPARITVTPLIDTGLATVAEKLSPGTLIFDPSAEVVVTAMCVPAGITIGGGGGGGGGGAGAAVGAAAVGELDAGAPADGAAVGLAAGVVAGASALGEVAGAAGCAAGAGCAALLAWLSCFLQPPASSRPAMANGKIAADIRLVFITAT